MRKTIDHLITPRYKILAMYPCSPYQIGDIVKITQDDSNFFLAITTKEVNEFSDGEPVPHERFHHISEIEEYPAVFKKMYWWEERTEDEMPEYLKIKKDVRSGPWEFFKIKKWEMSTLQAFTDIEKRIACSVLTWNPEMTYQPATEQEYLDYIKNRNNNV